MSFTSAPPKPCGEGRTYYMHEQQAPEYEIPISYPHLHVVPILNHFTANVRAIDFPALVERLSIFSNDPGAFERIHDRTTFLVMPLFQGTLSQLFEATEWRDSTVRRLAKLQVASALAHLGRNYIVHRFVAGNRMRYLAPPRSLTPWAYHRDVRAANFLFTRRQCGEGEELLVVLADFGLAIDKADMLPFTNEVAMRANLYYLAPEIREHSGRTTHLSWIDDARSPAFDRAWGAYEKADVWSAGMMWLLSLFDSTHHAAIFSHCAEGNGAAAYVQAHYGQMDPSPRDPSDLLELGLTIGMARPDKERRLDAGQCMLVFMLLCFDPDLVHAATTPQPADINRRFLRRRMAVLQEFSAESRGSSHVPTRATLELEFLTLYSMGEIQEAIALARGLIAEAREIAMKP